jgi:hypothetical protein
MLWLFEFWGYYLPSDDDHFLNNHAKIPHSFTQNHSSPNLNKRMMNDIWYCLVLFDENYFKT